MSLIAKAKCTAALAAAGALTPADAAIAADPIAIGITVSQTDRFALAGQSGARVWLDDVNASGEQHLCAGP